MTTKRRGFRDAYAERAPVAAEDGGGPRPGLSGRKPAACGPVRCIAGHRSAIPLREALILQAAISHPWLLHDHLEELAAAEFRHVDTQKLKGALIDVFAHHFC